MLKSIVKKPNIIKDVSDKKVEERKEKLEIVEVGDILYNFSVFCAVMV
jgi:hypothetical protein